jgi:hypothetical protein
MPAFLHSAEANIQFDIGPLLNARPVSVTVGTEVVHWNTFTDSYGGGSAFITMAAGRALGLVEPKALPDDPLIPSNGIAPEMQLHYANGEARQPQARLMSGDDTFVIPVTPKAYRGVFLAMTGGTCTFPATLVYAEGEAVIRQIRVPDYFNLAPKGNDKITALVSDIGKWNRSGKTTERDHHTIFALDLRPDPKRVLREISITKTGPANVILWGAAGIPATP